MEKLVIKCILVLLAIFISFICTAQNLLNGPQKIVVDSQRNCLLVSNFNTGDIVSIDSAGNQTYFVQGADFVDGLEIVGDTVYGIGNNRKITAYNLVTKQQVLNVTIPGSASNYLSSITSDSAGHLFISCPNLNEIYRMRISDRSVWVFAKDNGLNKPNGILLEKENNRIVVIDDSPGTSLIHAISLTDSTVSTLMSTSFNRPDGIVRDKYGYYYIGGYYLPGLYQVVPGFTQPPELFFYGTTIVYPTYDKPDHSLLITHYDANTWERVPLTTTGIHPLSPAGEFFLSPGNPNPFKSAVTIRYNMNKQGFTRLDIYDTIGILIQTLVNGIREPGTYTVAWDGKNFSGKEVPNGNYYLRMKMNAIVQTQKVTLIR